VRGEAAAAVGQLGEAAGAVGELRGEAAGAVGELRGEAAAAVWKSAVVRKRGLLWGSVGKLQAQVSFSKEPYKKDDILQTRTISLRSLLIVANPYS